MLTLALDTTTRGGSVAVVRGSSVLAAVAGDASRTHGERVPAEIEHALREANVRPVDLELLAVASGPGAFTGLRIGLATIQGLAMVLNLPVIAVSALDALALSAQASLADGTTGGPDADAPRIISAWMDAQRGEVFAAQYAAPGVGVSESARDAVPVPFEAPLVASPHTLLQALPPGESVVFIGDAALRYRAEITQSADAYRVLDTPMVLALAVARVGLARAARGEAGPPHALQPLYVRRPDAELERLRRGAG